MCSVWFCSAAPAALAAMAARMRTARAGPSPKSGASSASPRSRRTTRSSIPSMSRSLRAKKGEEYLLSEFGDSFGPSAQLIYLWPGGPEEFTIEVNTTAEFPFTASCPLNTAQPYYAVFEDVTVYADEALSTKLCDLEAGTALPRTNALAGYSITTLEFFGPNVYEVYLNAFSAQCGADTGYVNVQPVESFDSTTWLVPIIGVLHP